MYQYENMRPKLFTDEGLDTFLKIRDRAHRLISEGGAFTLGAAIRGASGDSWLMLACVDRLLEKEEIREVTDPKKVAAQDRVFVGRR